VDATIAAVAATLPQRDSDRRLGTAPSGARQNGRFYLLAVAGTSWGGDMLRFTIVRRAALVAALSMCAAAGAADIGQIKIAKGEVMIERGAQTLPGVVGARLQAADVVRTGADGSVGIVMSDNALLSAGPNSILSLDRFEFDPATSQGQFDASLRKGSLSVISGRIAKQTPGAMTVRTPAAVLGVRGTEFVASVDD
jgi:hypothetical protein